MPPQPIARVEVGLETVAHPVQVHDPGLDGDLRVGQILETQLARRNLGISVFYQLDTKQQSSTAYISNWFGSLLQAK